MYAKVLNHSHQGIVELWSCFSWDVRLLKMCLCDMNMVSGNVRLLSMPYCYRKLDEE